MMLNYELYFNDKKAYYFKTKHIDDEKLAEEISVGIANLFKSLIPKKEVDYTFASVKDDSCYLFVSEKVDFKIRGFLLEHQALKESKDLTTDDLMNRIDYNIFNETFHSTDGFIDI